MSGTHFGGRTLARSQALQLLFQAEANKRSLWLLLEQDEYVISEGPLDDYAKDLALGADGMRHDLDAVISTRSTTWTLSRMPAVDRNLLRLALYEMLEVDEVDVAVTIDECVELAKAYGTDESSRFVNGLLGRVADDLDAGVDVVEKAKAVLAEREADESEDGETGADADDDADADADADGDADANADGDADAEPSDDVEEG